jgi:hypothetical protein
VSTPPQRRPAPTIVWGILAAACVAAGAAVALYYHQLDLTLTHYDARGHLVVARRILDSLTPGWQQVGAVWLPLPHLLNALPVQIDAFYRTGASGVAISIASFAVAAVCIARIVAACTGSAAAALAAVLVFVLNPNVLYLQSTPMTEPLLMALTTAAVWLLIEWCRHPSRSATWPGVALILACLTRYEAWPVAAGALAAAAWARWRQGDTGGTVLRRVAAIAAYPAVAIAVFLVFSRIVIGEWFVSGGFFIPENESLGDALLAVKQVLWGVRELSGPITMWIAAAGLAAATIMALAVRDRAYLLIPVSLAMTAALPMLAFYEGHPYRIRYMVPLMAAQAVAAGLVCGLLPRWRAAGVLAVAIAAAVELHPLDNSAPMVTEAQWDRPNITARERVTGCLRASYRGETVMASMGSLGHYMQELSRAGFSIRDFLHEGNGDVWLAALSGPKPYAGWLLIEEKAEGGDMLAALARRRPAFLNGFTRVCEAAGVVLYRRGETPEGTGETGINNRRDDATKNRSE